VLTTLFSDVSRPIETKAIAKKHGADVVDEAARGGHGRVGQREGKDERRQQEFLSP
jgi:hypothetical protein